MAAARSEVAVGVFLELVAVDDDRRLGLALPAFLQLRLRVGIGILDLEDHLLAVGRPGHSRDAARDARNPLGFPARTIQEPHLGSLLDFLLVAAGREERQMRARRTPARLARARRAPRETRSPGAVPAHHPEIPSLAVLLRVEFRDGVGHPIALRRDLDVGHGVEPGKVLRGERSACGLHRARKREQGDTRAPEYEPGERKSSEGVQRRRGYTRGQETG